jgi:hypothetical protein
MFVFVTAFTSNINQQKSITQYIEYGNKLLSYKISNLRIVFIERKIYNEYFTNNTDNNTNNNTDNNVFNHFTYEGKVFEFILKNNTIFVMFEKTDNYLYKYIDNLTNFSINTDNPCKDTLEYMFIQCHKTEWIKMAISVINYVSVINNIKETDILTGIDIHNHTQLMWVDFGIYHIFKNDELFYNEIDNLNKKYISLSLNNRVRIGSCIHPSRTYHTDIYKTIAWYFAGGVFGGSLDSLLQFSELMKIECISIIQERKHLMWEVNVWYLIYLKFPELFDLYKCDHNSTIISNY